MKAYRCKNCGRFFRPILPDDEACGYTCWADLEAVRERWARLRGENLLALERLNLEAKP